MKVRLVCYAGSCKNQQTLASSDARYDRSSRQMVLKCRKCGAEDHMSEWICNNPKCGLPPQTFFYFGDRTEQKAGAGLLRAALRGAVMKGDSSNAALSANSILLGENAGQYQMPGGVTIHLVDDEVTLKGQFLGPDAECKGKKTVLLLSGSGGNINQQMNSVAKGYQHKGWNALCVDYRGYGASDGTPSSRGFYSDAMAMWQFLIAPKEQGGRELARHNICIHGYSIGSGPATELTVRLTKNGQLPSGLILQYPIASTQAIGAVKSGYQAAGWIAGKAFGFRNEDKIGQISVPVAILQAHVKDDFFAMAQIF